MIDADHEATGTKEKEEEEEEDDDGDDDDERGSMQVDEDTRFGAVEKRRL